LIAALVDGDDDIAVDDGERVADSDRGSGGDAYSTSVGVGGTAWNGTAARARSDSDAEPRDDETDAADDTTLGVAATFSSSSSAADAAASESHGDAGPPPVARGD
jgi:hypothetical protein